MGLELEIAIKNGVSKELKRIQSDLNRFNKSTQDTNKAIGGMNSSLFQTAKGFAVYAGAMYTAKLAYDGIIARGLEYNNLLVNQRNSIATLINVTSQNVDSMGKQLNYQDKMNLSLANSNKLMAELTKLNANTPQTLGQTAQIFKTMYAPMQKVGASQKDLLFLTEKLAIASKVGGVEFNSLLAGVDGLASGTVLANSDLGRFLSSLGLTNEALKNSSDVVGLLKDKLSDFKAFDDLDTAVSNLNVQWDTLVGNMTEDIYSAQKGYVKGLTKYLADLNEALADYSTNINSIQDLRKITDIATLEKEMYQLALKRVAVENEYFLFEKDRQKELDSLDTKLKMSSKYLSFLEKINKEKKASLVSTSAEVVDNGVSDSEFQLADEQFNKMDTRLAESLEYKKSMIMSDTSWQDYYTSIGDKENAWLIESANMYSKYADLTEVEMKNLLKIAKKEFFDEIKESEEFKIKIDLDTSSFKGIGKELASMSKGFESLGSEQKAFNEASKDMQKGTQEYQQAESQHTQNQLNGYANLAGVMSGMYAEGSDQAKGLIAIQTALSVVSGITAIANAMANGDGYTAVARGVAVAGALASFGWSGKSGGGTDVGQTNTVNQNTASTANFALNQGVDLSDYTDDFDSFMQGIKNATDALEAFGNVGTSASYELSALAKAPSSIDAQINSEQIKQLSNQAEYDRKKIDVKKYEKSGGLDVISKLDKSFSYTMGKNEEYALENYADKIKDTDKKLEELAQEKIEAENNYNQSLEDILSGALDFSNYSIDELNNAIGYNFDAKSADEVAKKINELSMETKELGYVSESAKTELAGYYNGITEESKNFIKSLDYADAISQLDSLNSAMLDASKSMLFSSNDYEMSLKSIGATNDEITDIRRSQLAEEMAFLREKTPELSKVTADNFVKLYDEMQKSSEILDNEDYINAMEEYGELLIEQAEFNYEASNSVKEYNDQIANTKASLEERLRLASAVDDADKLAITRDIEKSKLIDDGNKQLLDAIYLKEDEAKALDEAIRASEEFERAMGGIATSLNNAIDNIRGNLLSEDASANTSQLIRDYNDAINKQDYESASNIATTISGSAFGDTADLNKGLISSLEQTKLSLGLEDEILNVNIVSSELVTTTQTTPTVTVANPSVTSNDTMETILIEVLKTNKRVETILERIENNQEI